MATYYIDAETNAYVKGKVEANSREEAIRKARYGDYQLLSIDPSSMCSRVSVYKIED